MFFKHFTFNIKHAKNTFNLIRLSGFGFLC